MLHRLTGGQDYHVNRTWQDSTIINGKFKLRIERIERGSQQIERGSQRIERG